ncbi:MAG: hypothetical protein ACO1ON_13025 [Nocardioides sp.]
MSALICTECGGPRSKESTSGRCRPCWQNIPARQRTGTFGDFQLRASHLITEHGPSIAPDITRDQARAAAIQVAGRVPRDEVRGLLDALGITDLAGVA